MAEEDLKVVSVEYRLQPAGLINESFHLQTGLRTFSPACDTTQFRM